MRDIEDLSACSKLKHKQVPICLSFLITQFYFNDFIIFTFIPFFTLPQQQDPPRSLALVSESSTTWVHPLSLDSLYALIQSNSSANKKLVVGNTTNGIWPDKGMHLDTFSFFTPSPHFPPYNDDNIDIDMYIDVKDIPDLLTQTSTSAGLTVGAR